MYDFPVSGCWRGDCQSASRVSTLLRGVRSRRGELNCLGLCERKERYRTGSGRDVGGIRVAPFKWWVSGSEEEREYLGTYIDIGDKAREGEQGESWATWGQRR